MVVLKHLVVGVQAVSKPVCLKYHSLLTILISKPKQPSCKKKECGPQKGQGEKRCEIQGGSQEMAGMVG